MTKTYRFIALILACVLMLAGCGEKEQAIDYEALYAPVLDQFHYLISGCAYSYSFDGDSGVSEIMLYSDPADALGFIGYAITDLSGDGIPELYIGSSDEAGPGSFPSTRTLAVYNCTSGQPALSFESWFRSDHNYLGDGAFYSYGSSGFDQTAIGRAVLSEDGSSLKYTDFYFTMSEPDNIENLHYYYNSSGEWDTSVSQLLDDDGSEFNEAWDILASGFQYIDVKPFADYTPSKPFEGKALELITAYEAAGSIFDSTVYTTFIADEGPYSTAISFYPVHSARDFKLLKLSNAQVAGDGTVSFDTEAIYETEVLVQDMPLVVSMTLEGTIPGYGISYTDYSGSTRYFSVNISGMDGTIELTEF